MGEEKLPLEYASAERQAEMPLLRFFRQGVFALGVGLLLYGIGDGVGRALNSTYIGEVMGWGAALIALVMPLPRWR